MATVKLGEKRDVEKNKVYAILAYLGILCLVPLFAAKDSPYAKYHANQGLVLFLIEVALGVLGNMIGVVSVLAGLGFVLLIMPLVWLALFVLAIMGIINAANGEMKPLPIIGGITLVK